MILGGVIVTDRVVCFGEIMLRLSTPGHSRFVQAEAKKGLPAPGKKPGRRSRGEPEVPPQGMDIG